VNILNAILGAIGGMLIALLLLMVYNRFNQKK
jgi:biopolymer transport protein ExbB/TolQ